MTRQPRPPAGVASRDRFFAALLAALLGLALVTGWVGGELAARLESPTLDWRFRLRGPVAPPAGIIIVAIDDRSVARLGVWPPPREMMALAMQRLHQASPAVIALNLIIGEGADPPTAGIITLLQQVRGRLPSDADALRRRIDQVLAEQTPDLALVLAMADAARVVLPYAFVPDPAASEPTPVPPSIASTAFRLVVEAPGATIPDVGRASRLLGPAAPFAVAAASLGHVNTSSDPDGVLRRHAPALRAGDAVYPSLGLEAARLFLALPPDAVTLTAGNSLALGPQPIPLDRDSRAIINSYGPTGSFPTLSLLDVLFAPELPANLEGGIVLVGATASGVGDWFATPFDRRLPGTEHLATVIANLLDGSSLRRDAWTRTADAMAVLVLALAGAGLAGRWAIPLTAALVAGLTFGWLVIAYLAFAQAGTWLAVTGPVLALVLACGLVEAVRAQRELRRRRFIERQRANLARYFAPQVAERLAALDEPFTADRTELAAVMFVDLVGYTGVAERLRPAAAMALLREFHDLVETAVFRHHGFVGSHMGDGALACFGIPEARRTACAEAVAAAREVVERCTAWAAEHARRGQVVPRVSVGIHAGPVLMGDIGGKQQFQFTIVGDTVNVASRLESLTRVHAAAILVSEEAMRRARDHDPAAAEGFEAMGAIAVRGRALPIAAWSLRIPCALEHGDGR